MKMQILRLSVIDGCTFTCQNLCDIHALNLENNTDQLSNNRAAFTQGLINRILLKILQIFLETQSGLNPKFVLLVLVHEHFLGDLDDFTFFFFSILLTIASPYLFSFLIAILRLKI